jgi:ribonuclease HI
LTNRDHDFELFTDGACSGNPGPGGWAYILRDLRTGVETRGAEGAPDTTNNRMELQSVLSGLERTPHGAAVRLVTDSQYVAKGITEWMPGWKARGWMRKEGKQLKPVKNVEMWRRLDALLAERSVAVEHVLGHAGHPENEECDRMAVAAYQKFLS